MNDSILNIEIQEFIESNLNSDITSLLFKKSPFQELDIKELVEQIEAKNKCKSKLPTWYNKANIYYPNKLNIEQTSSEITAEYKSKLVSGKSLIDLTGGFGVDSYYFSKQMKNVIHCEWNQKLSLLVRHNYQQLKVSNIDTKAIDGLDYLFSQKQAFNWIYVDPSRRHDSKGKVFFLKDCEPNLPEHLDMLLGHTRQIMIKTSPLLDIKAGLDELYFVKEIHCVAVENEMKELLWILEKDFSQDIQIKTINLSNKGNQTFNFCLNELNSQVTNISNPKTYLYEPNSAVLKSGAFNLISQKLNVEKLHLNSHLYTSHEHIKNFPGRVFLINTWFEYSKNNMNKFHKNQANITVRNFPETVDSIRKKHKIKDGGNTYLFFSTLENGTKIVLECLKTVND